MSLSCWQSHTPKLTDMLTCHADMSAMLSYMSSTLACVSYLDAVSVLCRHADIATCWHYAGTMPAIPRHSAISMSLHGLSAFKNNQHTTINMDKNGDTAVGLGDGCGAVELGGGSRSKERAMMAMAPPSVEEHATIVLASLSKSSK